MVEHNLLACVLLVMELVTCSQGLSYDHFHVHPLPIQFEEEPTDHLTVPGTDVTLVCTNSQSSRSITWYHNNTIIKPAGPHYNISSNDHGTSTLTVRNVTTDDQGEYHCCVSEWRNEVRSRAGLLKVVNHKDADDLSFNITLHSTITLPCQLTVNVHGTEIVWLKDHKAIKKEWLVHNSTKLVIRTISVEDGGEYHCQVNDSGVIINGSSYFLKVQNQFQNTSKGPVIHNSSPSQYLLIKPDNNCDRSPHNQTLTLQCQVTGHPSPVISWYHNGELVNFTDHYFDNTTIIVENNTWTLQGGDPCNLIGYWQCFATNNVGTAHSTTRVLPFGWGNLPGEPMLSIINLVERNDNNADAYAALFNVSWEAPSYLGGLDNVEYRIVKSDYDTEATNSISTKAHLPIDTTVGNYNELTISISIVAEHDVNSKFVPSNRMTVKKKFEEVDLFKAATGFPPPTVNAYCLTNGDVYFNWTLQQPFGNLSASYLQSLILNSWNVNLTCIDQNNDVVKPIGGGVNGGDLASQFVSVINKDYVYCHCGVSYEYLSESQSQWASAGCNVTMKVPSSVDPTTTTSTMTVSSTTRTVNILNTTSTEQSGGSIKPAPSTVDPSDTIATIEPSKTVMITTTTTRTVHTLATTSTVQSTGTNKPGSSSVVLLGVMIGLMLLMALFGTIICTVFIAYWRKRAAQYEDVKFLKFSQYLKAIKAPLSEDYGSTIHIADVSVCEAPVCKVTNWINNNGFTSSGDVLRSESLHSITTSEMITYICEKGKRNGPHLPHCDSNTNTHELLQSKQVDVDSDQLSESNSEIPSHYLCEGGHKDKMKKSIKSDTYDETSSDISENSDVLSHYLCKHKHRVAKNVVSDDDSCSQLSEDSEVPSHYLRETVHHCKGKTSSFSVTTPSNDSISLYSDSLFLPEDNSISGFTPQNHFDKSNRKPPSLFILKESSSVPLLTPKIANPLFVKPNLGDSPSFTRLTKSADKTELTQRALKMSNQQSTGNNNTPSHYFCESKTKSPFSPYYAKTMTTNITSQCSNMLPSDSDTMSDIDALLLSVRNKESMFMPDEEPEVLFTPLTTNPLFVNDIRPHLTDSFMLQPVNKVDSSPQNLNQDDDVFSQQSESLSSSDIDVDDNCKTENSISPYYEKVTCFHCSPDGGNSHKSQCKDTAMNDNLSHTSTAAASKPLDLSLRDTIGPEVPCTPQITNPIFANKFKLDTTDSPATIACKELDFDESEIENYDTDSQADVCASSEAGSSDLGYWK